RIGVFGDGIDLGRGGQLAGDRRGEAALVAGAVEAGVGDRVVVVPVLLARHPAEVLLLGLPQPVVLHIGRLAGQRVRGGPRRGLAQRSRVEDVRDDTPAAGHVRVLRAVAGRDAGAVVVGRAEARGPGVVARPVAGGVGVPELDVLRWWWVRAGRGSGDADSRCGRRERGGDGQGAASTHGVLPPVRAARR